MLTEQEEKVLEECKKATSFQPVTRSRLKDLTKLTDRKNRQIIADLRDTGYRIVNGQKGYWYAESELEYKEWSIRYRAYANTIRKRIKAMDQFTEGQIEMRDAE